VLHDDPLSDDLARVIANVGLVKRVGDVTTGGVEVGKVHNRYEVEVAFEVTGVVAARQSEQFGYGAQSIESVTVCLPRLGRDTFGPADRHDLAEHLPPPGGEV